MSDYNRIFLSNYDYSHNTTNIIQVNVNEYAHLELETFSFGSLNSDQKYELVDIMNSNV